MKIITYSGHLVDFSKDEIDLGPNPILDIAMHLSRIPRYCGATKRFYSVLEHCLLVKYVAEYIANTSNPSVSIEALLHEVDEAYGLGDVVGQLKRKFCPKTRKMLKGYKNKIQKALGVDNLHSDIIDIADSVVLVYEWLYLLDQLIGDLDFKSEICKERAFYFLSRFRIIRDFLDKPKSIEEMRGYFIETCNQLMEAL